MKLILILIVIVYFGCVTKGHKNENETIILKILMSIIKDPEFQRLDLEQQHGAFFEMYSILEDHFKKIQEKKEEEEKEDYEDEGSPFLRFYHRPT